MKKNILLIILSILVFSFSPSSLNAQEEIIFNKSWKYAEFSKINSGNALLYRAQTNHHNLTVAVNAGHGTKGASNIKTQCHPDGTPKVTGGSTDKGEINAVAVSSGMVFKDGTKEAEITLKMAQILKEELLKNGYDVLMIRDSEDVQLDNIARTVLANNTSNIHISLHWDSTETDKGVFYMSVPDITSYRNMEPVKSYYEKHHQLGDSLIEGFKKQNIKIMGSGKIPLDLTQTSYSTIPSIDIELGDKISKHDNETLQNLSIGLLKGINIYFDIKEQQPVEPPKDKEENEPENPNIPANKIEDESKKTSEIVFKTLIIALPTFIIIAIVIMKKRHRNKR